MLQILMNPMPSQEVLDEIVLTAMAVVFELRRVDQKMQFGPNAGASAGGDGGG